MVKIIKLLLSITFIFISIAFMNENDASAKTSYLQSKDKIYKYELKDVGGYKEVYTNKFIKMKEGYRVYSHWSESYKETKKGLYHTYCSRKCEDSTKEIYYPIKKGRTWYYSDTYKRKIMATNLTIKTKAGTFKNVVKVRQYDYINPKDWPEIWDYYYAPNVGLIRNQNGYYSSKGFTWTINLIKLSNKK